ncbi:MAG: hypothetical protein M5T61_09405 [Acidimicrobiia bacterium]|nr:hypothetical protein [Acidimicrobiia bacterium]
MARRLRPVPFRGDRLDAALAAYDYDSGEAGAASIQMAIVGRGDPIDETLRVRDYREAYRGQALDFEGSLAIGGMRFDLGGCVGFDVRGKVIATSPNGPRPGGHVPPNDKPRGGASPRRRRSRRALDEGAPHRPQSGQSGAVPTSGSRSGMPSTATAPG